MPFGVHYWSVRPFEVNLVLGQIREMRQSILEEADVVFNVIQVMQVMQVMQVQVGNLFPQLDIDRHSGAGSGEVGHSVVMEGCKLSAANGKSEYELDNGLLGTAIQEEHSICSAGPQLRKCLTQCEHGDKQSLQRVA